MIRRSDGESCRPEAAVATAVATTGRCVATVATAVSDLHTTNLIKRLLRLLQACQRLLQRLLQHPHAARVAVTATAQGQSWQPQREFSTMDCGNIRSLKCPFANTNRFGTRPGKQQRLNDLG